MIAFKPTHIGVDLEKGFDVFISINPNRLPSYFLSAIQREAIRRLNRREAKAYRWFQELQDCAFMSEASGLKE